MSRRAIDCPHLPKLDAPIEWAVVSGGVLYMSHIPIRRDGSVEAGPIEAQAELTFANLRGAVEAAGATMADVAQVQIFLTRDQDFAAVNAAYRRYFEPPYPNRATVTVAGLLIPGMAIEIVAQAHVRG